MELHDLEKISEYLWEIPRTYRQDMRVPARVYTSESMLRDIIGDRSLPQLVNVASLPGIVDHALAMPDIHEGYGFPVGGVAAFDLGEGIISPGGIGYDINCGVRLLLSGLDEEEITDRKKEIAAHLFQAVPSGVGRGGEIRLDGNELRKVLEKGAKWALSRGYASKEDIEHIESGGCLEEADAGALSDRAIKRGRDQLGTLGAGNHFLEVLVVQEILDEMLVGEWGIGEGQVCVMIHTGSRGLGHQVATDYVRTMLGASNAYGITLPDRELACAPFGSDEGKSYFAAMAAAANYAWVNRQVITWQVRNAWERLFSPKDAELRLLYDVAHNIAKVEDHTVGGKKRKLIVHRKGATRSFPGQPVIIPGSMGTSSYILAGREKAMEVSFGSTCHGAGRRMSRSQAKREVDIGTLRKELEKNGIYVQAGSYGLIAEESPSSYKNVDEVVNVVSASGIATKVARLEPRVVVIG
jgi:tRNA-splicing ligase RtcB (3'-phosphate/5'-hydroxy nucleic acid ligase)